MTEPVSQPKLPLLIALSGIWLALLVFGHAFLNAYESKAAAATPHPVASPEASQIDLSGWTIVMAADPKYPGTRATVNQLKRLRSRSLTASSLAAGLTGKGVAI